MKRSIIVLALALAACSPGSADHGTNVVLDEFSIDGANRLAAGTSTITVVNEGNLGHTVVIADEAGEVVAATDLIGAGETASLDVDLGAGTYEFTCRIVFQTDDGSITDHYEAGMRKDVEVGS